MTTLRIAMLVTRSDVFGGAVVHVRDLASGLRAAGHDARVVIGGQGPMVDLFEDAGVPVTSVDGLQRAIHPRLDARALGGILETIDRDQPDIVHAHTAKVGLLGRIAAMRRRLPAVYTPHAWPFMDGVPGMSRQAYLQIERVAGRLPASVINVCHYERRYALERNVGSPRRHFTVHNGVPDVAVDLQGDPGLTPPRILVIARFEPQKDHETLLRALANVVDVDWTLELAGDGPTRPGCEALAASLGLGDRVHFLGEVHDVPARIAASQLVALSSRWEALPLTVLEAMRAGLPVVATDVGGVGEAVADGVTGRLVRRGDVVGMADALRELLTSVERRQAMGLAARRRYVEGFTVDAMVQSTLDVYDSTLDRHARAERRRPRRRGATVAATPDTPRARSLT